MMARAERRLCIYTEILQEAARLVLVGDNLVDVYGERGQAESAVPMTWPVVTHLAERAGGWLVSAGRLEKAEAGRAANTPAPMAPTSESPTHPQDTTKAGACQSDRPRHTDPRDTALPMQYTRGRAKLFKT